MHLFASFALLGVWPLTQLVACLAIVLSILTFRRGESRHRHLYAWLAWLYVVGCTATAVKLMCGMKPPPGPLEAIITAVFALVIVLHRGNLAHAHRCEWLRHVLAAFLAKLRRGNAS